MGRKKSIGGRAAPRADRLLDYWARERPVVAAIAFFGLTFNVSMALGPIWQGKLIDAIVSGLPLRSVALTALSFVALIAAIQVLRYFKRFYIRRFANGTSAAMRRTIYGNVMRKTVGELEGENAGNLMTRAISDVELCVEGMRKFTTELFDTGVLLASYLVSLFLYDVPLTLVSIAFIPVAMLLAEKLKTAIYRYASDWRKKNSEIGDLTWTMMENAMLYRVKGREGANARRYAAELDDLSKKAVRANLLENSMQPIYNAIAMVGIVAVIVSGGAKVIAGAWTIGAFSAYVSIFVAMAFKASKASKLFNSVQKSRVSWRRIKPYLSGPIIDCCEAEGEAVSLGAAVVTTDVVAMADENSAMLVASVQAVSSVGPSVEPLTQPLTPPQAQPLLSVSNLSLRYGDARENAVAGISFTARTGEIVGITGPVASGKSSLAIALTGLYPYGGSVLVAGRELRDLSPEERSRAISWMGHRSELFSDSVRNNVALGENIDVSGAIGDVFLDSDLMTMPNGLDTRVGNNGVRLSGGQRARVALARALVRARPIVILDDPFSAVDVRTEGAIMRNLRERYRGSLIILVSHRLTVFPQTDRVILLRGDGGTEYGTHESLLRDSPLYGEIFSLQRRRSPRAE